MLPISVVPLSRTTFLLYLKSVLSCPCGSSALFNLSSKYWIWDRNSDISKECAASTLKSGLDSIILPYSFTSLISNV